MKIGNFHVRVPNCLGLASREGVLSKLFRVPAVYPINHRIVAPSARKVAQAAPAASEPAVNSGAP